MSLIERNEEGVDPRSRNRSHRRHNASHSHYRLAIKANVTELISSLSPRCSPCEWHDVTELLGQLACSASFATPSATFPPASSCHNNPKSSVVSDSDDDCSSHDDYDDYDDEDPSGRLLLSAMIRKNPSVAVLEAALRAFPEALHQNPAAFFTACRDASSDVLVAMLRHCLKTRKSVECPYPWLISGHVSLEGAKCLIEAYPEGVLEKSRLLSGHNLVDYFLMSKDMVEQRRFDVTLWNKFKLILLAAGFAEGEKNLLPVHTIIRRIVLQPELFTNEGQSHHLLWLLHQLRWTDRWVFEKANDARMYPVHMMLSLKCTIEDGGLHVAREVIKILLEACPGSVKQMVGGRTCLHMAVRNGWPCHDLLLALYPESLDIRDPETNLYPFQVAAAGSTGQSTVESLGCSGSLDVTYELFRANPSHASVLMEGRVGRKRHERSCTDATASATATASIGAHA